MAIDQKTKKGAGYRSPWVWTMVGFFLVVFAVNYGFYTVSSTTTSGLVNEEYYKYGLQQNKIDKQYRKQAVRGWQIKLAMAKSWQVNEAETLNLFASDKNGQPLRHGQAEITAYRPSDAKADVIIHLTETEEAGRYSGELLLPLPGVWDINLLFNIDGEKHMFNQRIEVGGQGSTEPTKLEKVVQFLTGK